MAYFSIEVFGKEGEPITGKGGVEDGTLLFAIADYLRDKHVGRIVIVKGGEGSPFPTVSEQHQAQDARPDPGTD